MLTLESETKLGLPIFLDKKDNKYLPFPLTHYLGRTLRGASYFIDCNPCESYSHKCHRLTDPPGCAAPVVTWRTAIQLGPGLMLVHALSTTLQACPVQKRLDVREVARPAL